MKQFLFFINFVVLICFMSFIESCDNPPKNEFEFFYYPKLNVYYNVSLANYLYSIDAGRTWDTVNFSPGSDTEALGKKIILHSPGADIWKDNEQHRKLYDGKFYNIESTASTGASERATDKIAPSKFKRKTSKAVLKTEEETSGKKLLKDFFKKLFGKRKKAEPTE